MSRFLKEEIKNTLIDYPNLKFNKTKYTVTGDFEIINENTGVIIETYNLKIEIPVRFTKLILPRVTEISHKIPRHPDRHVYKDGLFCLGTPLSEYLICSKGITFKEFIEKILRPFLATQLAITKKWLSSFPQGEFGHGAIGIYESYSDFFNTKDKNTIITGIKIALNKNQRNKVCFCSSGKKLKHCHMEYFNILRTFGKKQLLIDLKLINSLP